jgi:L-alanine-DL-glutamate epimerase-like enolase superfamily enzyme
MAKYYQVVTHELLGEEKVTYVRRYNNKERAMQIAESLIEDGYTYVKIEDSKGETYAEYEI